MKPIRDSVRSLERQESGEIRRLRCSVCGVKLLDSAQQLELHNLICARSRPRQTDTAKVSYGEWETHGNEPPG